MDRIGLNRFERIRVQHMDTLTTAPANGNSGSGDCPPKHLVWSNLKIGTERLVDTGPKTQSPWRGPRMPR